MALPTLLNFEYFNLKAYGNRINCSKLITFYILVFALIYTLVPCLFYQGIFPDSAQNIAWGRTWEWSYNRHPPLGTWLLKVMCLLFGNIEVAVYTANACCLSLSLWFIYRLAKHYMSEQDALVACILSSFSVFYLMYYALEFNQNTIMLPCWIMVAYFFDQCLKKNLWRDWLILAVVSAAAMLAKYESGIILILAFMYLSFHYKKEYTLKLIAAFGLFLLLLTPHLLSVANHGFIPWFFIQSRIDDSQAHGFFYKHLFNPLSSLLEQFGHISPALLIMYLLVNNRNYFTRPQKNTLFFGNYLVYLGYAPLVFVLSLSLLLGITIRSEWGFPLFSFTLPALFSYWQLKTKPAILPTLIIIAFSLHIGVLLGHKSVHYFSSKDSRANFPSYQLATIANDYWQQFTDKPLKYVGGEENADYYLSTYLPSKPLLFEAFSLQNSHWLTESDLHRDGMLLILTGCDKALTKHFENAYKAQASSCQNVPLNNKYKPQFKQFTLMVIPPKK